MLSICATEQKFKPITQIGVHNKLRQKLESRTAEMKFHLFLQAPEDALMDQISSVLKMVHQCKNQFQILTAQRCTGSTHDLAMMKKLNIDSLVHES